MQRTVGLVRLISSRVLVKSVEAAGEGGGGGGEVTGRDRWEEEE